MADYVYWFILALILLGLEMASGTFYLLVISVSSAVGGMAALTGFNFSVQMVFSAITAIIGIVLIRSWKGGRAASVASQNLDIGQVVRVVNWGEQGKLRVHFRGADWDAELEPADATRDGALYIKDMRGSILILSHDKPD